MLYAAHHEQAALAPIEAAHAVVPATSARHIALAGRLADGQLVTVGWANLEINSGVRAVFGLSYHRHGDRLFLEGTGTVADQDVDVVGVLAVAPRGADVLVAVALTDDPFALVVVGAEAEIVLPEGTVGGENDQALYGAQELSNCAQ